MRIGRACVWLSGLVLFSCGEAGTEVSADKAEDVTAELPSIDVAAEAPLFTEVVEVAAEVPDVRVDACLECDVIDLGRGPGPGEPGSPCETGEECNDGFCIKTPDGMQCTQVCQDECPFGWKCAQHTPSLPDQVFICVPTQMELCRACGGNTDCWSGGVDAGEACVSYGPEGWFCGAACEAGKECPEGYHCGNVEDVGGAIVSQCVLDQGVCVCTQAAVDEQAETSCWRENEWGRCDGARQCRAWGLTECSAAEPDKEECNAADDDCDGETDEETGGGVCFVTNQFGSCPGVWECADGEPACEGEEAHAEQCDGDDNDCDGVTDEGFEDTDGDGVADCLESDVDGDGVVDGLDNCKAQFNPEQKDADADNFGDVCDLDDDNDKTPDSQDCAPFDDEMHAGADETCDGKDNDCNFIVDEGFADTDSDGWKDCVDEDDDNDAAVDPIDCVPLDAAIHPGAAEECNGKDDDCDNQVDEGWPDADGDGLADCIDQDADGDGIPDGKDNCPLVINVLQEDLDKDGLGDMCDNDLDGDSIANAADNCPTTANALQGDTEKDGVGDACDPDMDNDDLDNEGDNCPFVANEDQADADNDGTGDACENDKDGDGTPDALDCQPLEPAVHPAAQETCDGVDNDCDYVVDEGFPDADADGLKNCVDGDDDGDGEPDATDCADADPLVNHDAAEVCDGKDNDCDAQTDEGLGKISCGKGQCAHSVPACVTGKPQPCDPFEGIGEEVCDGKDNDCNGLTDEGQGKTTCGLGVCVHTVPSCVDGEVQLCDALDGAGPEGCDGLDNDCDGKTDEDLPLLACGKGICFHTVQSCTGGVEQACDPLQGKGTEVCDGVDNDCDGETDEELGAVSCGLGACVHEQPYCVGGKVVPCQPFVGAGPEVCDAADNDCDGLTDEDQPAVACGLGACAQVLAGCTGGQVPDCDPLEGASAEVCDGVDNDCDGQIDEALGFAVCGLGQCLHAVANCEDGAAQTCDPKEGAGPEECDGLDNDCDGVTDPADTQGCADYYLDSDADGYGVASAKKCLCDAAAPYSAEEAGDCDDGDAGANPGLNEDCDLAGDENCDGQINEGCSYLSCKDVKAQVPAAASGSYTLDPDGPDGSGKPFAAYCEMTLNGGGWTLVMKTSSASAYVYDNAVWSSAAGGSTVATDPSADEDYVSAAFYVLTASESMAALGSQANWNSWHHASNNARNLSNQSRMSGAYDWFGTCPAQSDCGTEPIHKRPLGLQQGTSASYSNKWNRFGYVNDVNGWGTRTRVGFTGDNDGSDSSDSVMGLGLECTNACLSGSCTGAPHGKGSGFYLYVSWADQPLDGAVRGWLWVR